MPIHSPLEPPLMTPQEFHLLGEQIGAYCGLSFREEMKYLLERRLAPRLQALDLSDYGSYHRYLRYDPQGRAELAAAVELLVTHETYFFRELEQLKAFSEEILPELAAERGGARRLRIWSAGCSTGEEAYTIAILLLESKLLRGWDAVVFGSDLSRRALAHARRGEYAHSAMRSIAPDLLGRYFRRDPAGRYQVVDSVRELVTFGQVNLLDGQNTGLVSSMDVIFCRNVMIYFDLPARRRVLKVFYDKLREGGLLLLGHSENLINATADFELVHLKRDLVYRRPRA